MLHFDVPGVGPGPKQDREPSPARHSPDYSTVSSYLSNGRKKRRWVGSIGADTCFSRFSCVKMKDSQPGNSGR